MHAHGRLAHHRETPLLSRFSGLPRQLPRGTRKTRKARPGTRASDACICLGKARPRSDHSLSSFSSIRPLGADRAGMRRLLLRRRHGCGRGAPAPAIRQAEAEALIAAAMELDATGRSWKQQRGPGHVSCGSTSLARPMLGLGGEHLLPMQARKGPPSATVALLATCRSLGVAWPTPASPQLRYSVTTPAMLPRAFRWESEVWG